MSNEMMFRAWAKKKKKYCNVDQLDMDFDGKIEDVWIWEDDYIMVCASITEVIIEQYTGLNDKNGKPIYEGDIVKIMKNSPYKDILKNDIARVAFWQYRACFGIEIDGKRWATLAGGYLEVIGNIHENPELLNAS